VSGPEVQAAVRDYLRHTGGSEVDQIFIGPERRATLAEVRAALKRLGAVAWRSVNAWSCLKQNVQTCSEARNWTARRFTVYKLPA
jgi:hypothetical protein